MRNLSNPSIQNEDVGFTFRGQPIRNEDTREVMEEDATKELQGRLDVKMTYSALEERKAALIKEKSVLVRQIKDLKQARPDGNRIKANIKLETHKGREHTVRDVGESFEEYEDDDNPVEEVYQQTLEDDLWEEEQLNRRERDNARISGEGMRNGDEDILDIMEVEQEGTSAAIDVNLHWI